MRAPRKETDMRRSVPLVLLSMLLGASLMSPAWGGGSAATTKFVKRYVKKQVKPLQRQCRRGAVLAFASVSGDGQPQDNEFHPTRGFNCAGGAVEVRDAVGPAGAEFFDVRFTRLGLTATNPDLVAIVTAKQGRLAATVVPAGEDTIRVFLADTQANGDLVDADFSIAVFKA